MYASVVLKSKTRMTDRVYTYAVPTSMASSVKPGIRVIVPFGKGDTTSIGIVVEMLSDFEADFKVKEILEVVESEPILTDELVSIAQFMTEAYLSDLSSAFQTVMPPGDILTITEVFYPGEGSSEEDEPLIRFAKGGKTLNELLQQIPGVTKEGIASKAESGVLVKHFELTRGASIKLRRVVELLADDEERISGRAEKQREIFRVLRSSGRMELKELLKKADASLSSVKSMQSKGLVRILDEEVYRDVLDPEIDAYAKVELSEPQKAVYSRIVQNEHYKTFLLKGVTGSGKTEVYLQLVSEVLKRGKQAIVLVPEIALTPQTIHRFAGRFGSKVAVLHSKLSISERFDQWRMVKEGEVQIVVGTRSAIFAPFDNLGLIVIDEEHELSYVSDRNPKYDALEIAALRGRYHDCCVVLGTATPRVETYFATEEESFELLELKERVRQLPMPSCHIVDMREELKDGNFSMFSSLLYESIDRTLAANKQVILFLNKRGHTSYIFCRKCGYIQKCDACDVSMTYHATKRLSICHFCGRTSTKPLICPACGSNAIKEFGAGTQKLEEETIKTFPNARIVRMDADTMSTKGSYDAVFRRMKEGTIDILIGTQMLSKGFDFPNVLTVGIVAADLSLNIPDYRAQEKTFQLLTQVAGRAGRGDDAGEVIIQTYQPDHYAIRSGANHDYESFYRQEIRIRKEYRYPPFYDLITIRVDHEKRISASKKAFEIIKRIGAAATGLDAELIGPNPAVIERINNRFRFNIMIKTGNDLEALKEILDREVLRNSKLRENGFRIIVTINPISIY